jgi:hypothetical protein
MCGTLRVRMHSTVTGIAKEILALGTVVSCRNLIAELAHCNYK